MQPACRRGFQPQKNDLIVPERFKLRNRLDGKSSDTQRVEAAEAGEVRVYITEDCIASYPNAFTLSC